MTKEQAINYLFSSGFSDEQVEGIVKAFEPTTNLVSFHEINELADFVIEATKEIEQPDNYHLGMCNGVEFMRSTLTHTLPNYLEPTTKKCTTCAYREIDGKPHEMCKSCVCGDRYREDSTTKNDLGVDCISRKQAIEEADKLDLEADYENELVIEMLENLPSATLQEPRKGNWKNGHCFKCGCDFHAYLIEWKWKKDMNVNYCPNCGVSISEVKE